MEKPRLTPPPPIYNQFAPQDKFIARVTEINPLEKPDPFAGCKTGSDRLQRLLDMSDQTRASGINVLDFNRI